MKIKHLLLATIIFSTGLSTSANADDQAQNRIVTKVKSMPRVAQAGMAAGSAALIAGLLYAVVRVCSRQTDRGSMFRDKEKKTELTYQSHLSEKLGFATQIRKEGPESLQHLEAYLQSVLDKDPNGPNVQETRDHLQLVKNALKKWEQVEIQPNGHVAPKKEHRPSIIVHTEENKGTNEGL